MSFTEITSTSWFSRLGDSIKGILFGLIAIPVAIILLFWNEKREVGRTRILEGGAKMVVAVDAEKISPANENKLVYLTADATTSETLTDPDYGVSLEGALKLQRHVEYYQYQEEFKSETEKKLGGGTETVAIYDYSAQWVDSPIDSASFKDPAFKIKNTILKEIPQTTLSPNSVQLGAYQLSSNQITRLIADTQFSLTADHPLPAVVAAEAKVSGNNIYYGTDAQTPSIGDARVHFTYTPTGTYSIIAQQAGNSFVNYKTKDDSLSILKLGAHSADSLFAQEASSNRMLSWILRAVGFALIAFGFAAILSPLSVVLDVVPFLGNIAEMGTTLIAFVLSLSISSVTIAIAWLTFRPLIGCSLLLITFGAIYWLNRLKKNSAIIP
jgi:hypothetical protein